MRVIGLGVLLYAASMAAGFTLPQPEAALQNTVNTMRGQFEHRATPEALTTTVSMPQMALYDAAGIDMAVAILTQPDDGPGGRTYRFQQDAVTYRINAPYPEDYQTTIRDAFAQMAAVTGMTVTQTNNEPDIDIVAKTGSGAYVSAQISGGAIGQVTIQLGCCSERAAREDITQAFGPFGDRGDERSIFSQATPLTAPTDWDWWVVRALYALPAGTGPEQVRAQLYATVP